IAAGGDSAGQRDLLLRSQILGHRADDGAGLVAVILGDAGEIVLFILTQHLLAETFRNLTVVPLRLFGAPPYFIEAIVGGHEVGLARRSDPPTGIVAAVLLDALLRDAIVLRQGAIDHALHEVALGTRPFSARDEFALIWERRSGKADPARSRTGTSAEPT